MIVGGIDIGALNTKAVFLKDGEILSYAAITSGEEAVKAANQAIDTALKDTGILQEGVDLMVATGSGKYVLPFTKEYKTIALCIAKGTFFLLPSVKTVIDIGAETITIIKIAPNGKMMNFIGNDACAAGTGIFLDTMAAAMRLPIDEFGEASLKAREKANITSMCPIFAESEVISLVHQGVAKEEIIAGIHGSVADRIYSLLKRVGLEKDVAVTGGVAKNPGVVKALEDKLGLTIHLPENSQMVAALGAALVAAKKVSGENSIQ